MVGEDEDYTINAEGCVDVPPAPSPLDRIGGVLATARYGGNKFPLIFPRGVSAFLARPQEHGAALSVHLDPALPLPCFTLVPTAAASRFHLLLTGYQRLRRPYKKDTKTKPDVFVTPHFLLIPQEHGVSEKAFKYTFVASTSPSIWASCSMVVLRAAADVHDTGGGGSGGDSGDGVPSWPGDLDDVSDRSVRQVYSHVRACYPASSGMERLVFNDMLTTIALDKPTLGALSLNQVRLHTWLKAVQAAKFRAQWGSDAFWGWAKVRATLESVLVRHDGSDDDDDDSNDVGLVRDFAQHALR